MSDDIAALTEAGQRFQAARDEHQAARDALDPLVQDAALADVSQQTIARLTGLTRETVRGIERRAGIPPRPPGRGR